MLSGASVASSTTSARILSSLPQVSAPTPRDIPAEFLDEIGEMRASGQYDWADSTLSGIFTTVRETRRVTEGQRRAVENIKAARGWSADDEVGDVRDGRRRRSGGVYRSVKCCPRAVYVEPPDPNGADDDTSETEILGADRL